MNKAILLKPSTYGLYTICNVLQSDKIIENVDSSFCGYFNVYHLLKDFMDKKILVYACYQDEFNAPLGLVIGEMTNYEYYEGHLMFNEKSSLSFKIDVLKQVVKNVKMDFPFCKGIVGYPPKRYKHVRLLMKKIGFTEDVTNVNFFGLNGIEECIKVIYEYRG